MNTWYWAALLLGITGSVHCAGMCGPIAFALPFGRGTSSVFKNLTYQFGRAFTYALLGVLFGLIGSGFKLAGMQQPLSIAIGALMLLSLVSKHPSVLKIPGIGQFFGRIQSKLGEQFKKRSYPHMLLTGMLNGLLPCGLVYAALLGSIGTTQALTGAGFMFFFGLGTIPMMFAMGIIGNQLTMNARNKMQKAVPYVISLFAILFILRGLGLGIPYLSPPDEALQIHQTQSCH